MSVYVSGMVWKRSRAMGTSFTVLLAIADKCDDAGKAYPKWDTSMATLARLARCSVRAAQYAVKDLIEIGELSRQVNNGTQSNTFQIHLDPTHDLFEAEIPKPVDKAKDSTRCGVQAVAPGGCNQVRLGVQPVAPNPSSVLPVESLSKEARKKGDPVGKTILPPHAVAWLAAPLTEQMKAWARAHGWEPFLDLHREVFADYLAKNENYAAKHSDMDACFRSCVRADWENVRRRAQMDATHGRAPDLTRWWVTPEGMLAKAHALGVVRRGGETLPHFEARILSAAVDADGWGVWVDPQRRSTEYDLCVRYRKAAGLSLPAEEVS